MATYRNPEDADTKLHRLLLKAVPENPHGNKTIAHLAERIGCTRASIFNWIKDDKLTPERAVQIVEVSKRKLDESGEVVMGEPRVTLDDLHEFVYAA